MANQRAAEDWLEQHGRPVDRAMVDFENGADSAALRFALAEYQNPDGGFGRALEPDLRLDDSSVIATTVGLQLLALCEAPASESLVARAMNYLRQAFDETSRIWISVPENVADAAHAPWWQRQDAAAYTLNTRAEIVGYMYRWGGYFPNSLRAQLTGEVMRVVRDAQTIEMHDLLVVDRLLQSPDFPTSAWGEEVAHFYCLAEAAIATDVDAWREYALTPLTVIRDPAHPLAGRMADAVAANLEYLSQTQDADGSWPPNWSWFGNFDAQWPQAERDIRSLLTAGNLCTLRRFGAHRAND